MLIRAIHFIGAASHSQAGHGPPACRPALIFRGSRVACVPAAPAHPHAGAPGGVSASNLLGALPHLPPLALEAPHALLPPAGARVRWSAQIGQPRLGLTLIAEKHGKPKGQTRARARGARPAAAVPRGGSAPGRRGAGRIARRGIYEPLSARSAAAGAPGSPARAPAREAARARALLFPRHQKEKKGQETVTGAWPCGRPRSGRVRRTRLSGAACGPAGER